MSREQFDTMEGAGAFASTAAVPGGGATTVVRGILSGALWGGFGAATEFQNDPELAERLGDLKVGALTGGLLNTAPSVAVGVTNSLKGKFRLAAESEAAAESRELADRLGQDESFFSFGQRTGSADAGVRLLWRLARV